MTYTIKHNTWTGSKFETEDVCVTTDKAEALKDLEWYNKHCDGLISGYYIVDENGNII